MSIRTTEQRLGMREVQMRRPKLNLGGAERSAGRSELGDILPPLGTVVHGSATSIAIPAGTSITTGMCGWYPLIDVPARDFGEDLVLFGWSTSLLSTNPTPTTPASQATWGTTKGERAAIVFGDGNLPIAANTWSSAPFNVAGINSALTLDVSERPNYLGFATFPAGSFTDAIPFKAVVPFLASPFIRRLTPNSRIQAALVVDGGQVTAGANKVLLCSIAVQMHLGLTQHPNAFRR